MEDVVHFRAVEDRRVRRPRVPERLALAVGTVLIWIGMVVRSARLRQCAELGFVAGSAATITWAALGTNGTNAAALVLALAIPAVVLYLGALVIRLTND
jgi:hypothetical protein